MASYWQKAKREAKKRASLSGYCWVWRNTALGTPGYWKQPYLFHESEVPHRPPFVPKYADLFGDGPYVPPEPTEEKSYKRESLSLRTECES